MRTLGRVSRERETRIRVLLSFAWNALERDALTVEEVREAVGRYILIHHSVSLNTRASYIDEVMAKLEDQREKLSRAALI